MICVTRGMGIDYILFLDALTPFHHVRMHFHVKHGPRIVHKSSTVTSRQWRSLILPSTLKFPSKQISTSHTINTELSSTLLQS